MRTNMEMNESVLLSVAQTLRRRWLLIVSTTVIVASAGIGLIASRSHRYTSSTDLLVHTQRGQNQVAIDIQTLQTIERLNETIAELAVQPTVLERVRKLANLPDTVLSLQGKIRAQPIPKTELIRISATDMAPERAQLIALATATVLTERVQEFDQLRQTGTTLTVAEPAALPVIPSSSPKRVQAVGMTLFSVFLALLVARVRDMLDVRVRSEEDIEALLHLPVVGKIQRFRSGTAHVLRTQDAFRDLQSSLQFLPRVEPMQAIAVTGTVAGEGKSTVVANLALAFHEVGQDVVVLDLDFRRPSLHEVFGISASPEATLGKILQGDVPIAAPLPTAYEHISAYLAGSVPAQEVTRLYQSPRLRELLQSLLDSPTISGRWVLGDLPPLLLAPGSIAAAAAFRNALFVLELGRSRVQHIRESLELLERGHVNVLGAVLTKFASHLNEYRGHNDSYRAGKQTSRS